jgi:transcriptional regulator with PAS, ATPase and Fis domain
MLRVNGNEMETTEIKTHACKCGKIYSTNSGLWKHSKTCNFKDKTEETETITSSNEIQELKEIMKYLMKENSEMKNMMMAQNTATQNMMMDVIKTGTHNNTTNNNSHNKTFNLNFFLNETCKNALNITDFVSSIKVSLDDLENTGRQGYVEGISNIILQKLQNLNHYDRPIHCADNKREVLYIKNDNQWIKESEEKPLLKKAIKTIANENMKQIKTWREQNPECTDAESKKNNLYLKIVSNSMSGSDKEECDKNLNKIISNVAKETIIPKDI